MTFSQNSQTLLSQLIQFQATLDNLKKQMALHLKDKNIPLDERWELFKNLPKDCYSKDSYGPRFSNMGDLVLHEGFIHADRYESIDVIPMVQKIEDAKNNLSQQKPIFQNDLKKIDVDQLKEEVLAKMTGSFIFDW